MTTGERIRNIREDKDVLQQELADAVGMNVSVLSRIEKGTRPIRDDELIKIAQKLSVSADFILGLSASSHSSFSQASHLAPNVQEASSLYHQLDEIDRAEIRGIMKGMLMSEKYKSKAKDTAG